MHQRNVIPKSKALTGVEDAVAIELETGGSHCGTHRITKWMEFEVTSEDHLVQVLQVFTVLHPDLPVRPPASKLPLFFLFPTVQILTAVNCKVAFGAGPLQCCSQQTKQQQGMVPTSVQNHLRNHQVKPPWRKVCSSP